MEPLTFYCDSFFTCKLSNWLNVLKLYFFSYCANSQSNRYRTVANWYSPPSFPNSDHSFIDVANENGHLVYVSSAQRAPCFQVKWLKCTKPAGASEVKAIEVRLAWFHCWREFPTALHFHIWNGFVLRKSMKFRILTVKRLRMSPDHKSFP